MAKTYRPAFLRTRLVREPLPAKLRGLSDLTGPESVYRAMKALYGAEPQEVMVAFLLNTRMAIVGMQEVTRGLVDQVQLHPREVFRAAILANATGVVVSHNHPSGDPTPSVEDRNATRMLAAAGAIVGIPLVDHIVVGQRGYVSLADEIRNVRDAIR